MARRKPNSSAAGAQSQAETAKAVEFFISAIRDPHNPRYCGACLIGAFSACTPIEVVLRSATAGKAKRSELSTTANPELWNAVLAFVMLKRTDKQIERLLVRLSACTCRLEGMSDLAKRFHEEGTLLASVRELRMRCADDLLQDRPGGGQSQAICKPTFLGRVFILNILIMFASVIEDSRIKSSAKGDSREWPTRATDLIPYGADDFVQTILQWYRFLPDSMLFVGMAFTIRVTQMLVIPSVIKYKFYQTIVESSRKVIDITMTDLLSDDKARIRASHRFEFYIPGLVKSYEVLVTHLSPDVRAAIWRGYETKAMQICSIFLYLSSDPLMPKHPAENLARQLVIYGQELFRIFHMHLPPRPSMPVHPEVETWDRQVFPPPASVRAPKEATLFAILDFRKESRCSAQGCTNALQTVGRDFQRCGRCAVVSYCGRECQIKAWKDEEFPHKRSCPMLRTLIELGGGPTLFWGHDPAGVAPNKFTILRNWDMAGFNEEQYSLIADWHKLISDSRGYPMPNGTEWTPGYEDYDHIIAQLSAKGRGPKAKFIDRLKRWPSEVAKEEKLLKLQPFWEQEIDC